MNISYFNFKKIWLLLAVSSCGICFSMDNNRALSLPKEVVIVKVGSQADKPT